MARMAIARVSGQFVRLYPCQALALNRPAASPASNAIPPVLGVGRVCSERSLGISSICQSPRVLASNRAIALLTINVVITVSIMQLRLAG